MPNTRATLEALLLERSLTDAEAAWSRLATARRTRRGGVAAPQARSSQPVMGETRSAARVAPSPSSHQAGIVPRFFVASGSAARPGQRTT